MDEIYDIKIPAFKAGKQVDSRGRKDTWTTDRLDKAIAAYNNLSKQNDKYLAPLIVKHLPGVGSNQDYNPNIAQGYVNEYVREGDVIFANGVRQFNRKFVEALRRGEHKKVSHSWHLPGSPHSPHPETDFPNHLAYVLEPSIPLDVPQYEAPDTELNLDSLDEGDSLGSHRYFSSYEFSLTDFSMAGTSSPIQPSENPSSGNTGENPEAIQLAEYRAGLDAEYRTKQEALDRDKQQQEANFQQQKQELDREKQQQQQELDRQRAEIAKKFGELKRAELSSFCKEHQSKFRAAEVPGAIDFMMGLDSSETADFSTGEGTEKKTALQWFKDFAASRADVSPVGRQEVAPPATDPKIPVSPSATTTVNYTAPDGTAIDPESADFSAKVEQFILAEKARGQEWDYGDAVNHLSKQGGK